MKQATPIPYRLISSFFVLILAMITWGFYRTYLVFFPAFTGFNIIHHFHGAVMMAWMMMLIIQPLLIRYGRVSIHRTIGRLSFIIAPLVVFSIFLTGKLSYTKPEPNLTHIDKIAGIALSIPSMFAFAIFYILAIYSRRNTYNHMRYMIGTALLMIGPGLGRALIIYFNVPFPVAVTSVNIIAIAFALVLLLNDVLHRRNFTAFTVIFLTMLLVLLAWQFRMTQTWQNIGELIARIMF